MPRKKEWFDDDSFWREFYPLMFPEQRIADADEQVANVLALTKPPGKSVLDLCCGRGRCSIALAKKGFSVTGVDRTKYLLDKARPRARVADLKIEWVQADMRDFVRANSFDLVLSMFTSFGYFDERREDMTVLENMVESNAEDARPKTTKAHMILAIGLLISRRTCAALYSRPTESSIPAGVL